MNENEETIEGIFNDRQQKRTKNGNAYTLIAINGTKMSVFENQGALVNIPLGAYVRAEYSVNNGFKNLKSIQILEEPLDEPVIEEEIETNKSTTTKVSHDERIVRQSCLKAAAARLAGIDPAEADVISLAEEMLAWVYGKDSN